MPKKVLVINSKQTKLEVELPVDGKLVKDAAVDVFLLVDVDLLSVVDLASCVDFDVLKVVVVL